MIDIPLSKMILWIYMLISILRMPAVSSKETRFMVTSVNCAFDGDTRSSIYIDGKDYSNKQDGLNIVVYDTLQPKSIKSLEYPNFDLHYQSISDHSLIIVTSQLICTNSVSLDLKTQKRVVAHLKKLGFKSFNLKSGFSAHDLRSAVYIFCKGGCHSNVSINIDLPFEQTHGFGSDPIILSFVVFRKDKDVYVTQSSSNNNDVVTHKTVLYIVIISSGVLIIISVLLAIYIYIRRRIYRPNLQKQNKDVTKEKNSEGYGCELLYCSTERNRKNNYVMELTTSARLFSKSDIQENQIDSYEEKPSFASYVKVDKDNRKQVYKVPSNVSRHKPPSYPPFHEDENKSKQLNTASKASSLTSSNDSYLLPHEYANPPGNNETLHADTDYKGIQRYVEDYKSLHGSFNDEDYIFPSSNS